MTDPLTYWPLCPLVGAWAWIILESRIRRRRAQRATQAFLGDVWFDVRRSRP